MQELPVAIGMPPTGNWSWLMTLIVCR